MTNRNSFLQKFPEVQRSPVQWKIEKAVNILFLVMIAIWMISCVSKNTNHSGIGKQLFGTLPDGRVVYLYTLQNGNGMTVKISDYGCIIQSIIVPDRNEHFADVVLGFDSL